MSERTWAWSCLSARTPAALQAEDDARLGPTIERRGL